MSLRKVFVKIKILFRIRIRISIMILRWILIPDLNSMYFIQKTPTKFWLDPLTPSKAIVSTWKVHIHTYRQTYRQEYGNFYFLITEYVKRESIVIAWVKKKNSLLLMNVHVLYTRGVQKIRWLCGFLKKYLFIDQYLCCPLQSNPR